MTRTTISVRDVARLKRNAQNVYPLVAQREKLSAKIAELSEELTKVNGQIEATETGSRLITGGVNSMDLIQRVVITTDKTDKNGAPIKVTKFEPIPGKLTLTEDGVYEVNISEPEPATADSADNDSANNNNPEEGEE